MTLLYLQEQLPNIQLKLGIKHLNAGQINIHYWKHQYNLRYWGDVGNKVAKQYIVLVDWCWSISGFDLHGFNGDESDELL
jgi:hypothetical protein